MWKILQIAMILQISKSRKIPNIGGLADFRFQIGLQDFEDFKGLGGLEDFGISKIIDMLEISEIREILEIRDWMFQNILEGSQVLEFRLDFRISKILKVLEV